MKEFIVKKADTLRNFTDNTYPQGSFCLDRLLKKRDVRVNGEKVGTNVSLAAGDRVTYYTTPAQEAKKAFDVIYADENVLVVDKDSGVNSEAVYAVLCEQTPDCRFIHRLDRNTQGLMIFAKTAAAEEELRAAFRERKVRKVYHAVCTGRFPADAAVLTAYLKKDVAGSLVSVSDAPVGEKIVTEYRILRRAGELTFVEVILHTGKTHQIRAHLAHIGCPVLGDGKYGDKRANARYARTRQCLLAKGLTVRTDGLLSYLGDRTFLSPRDLFSCFCEKEN